MSQQRNAWIEIDHAKLKANLDHLAKRAGVPVCAVVKANAYGHGASECAKTLMESGAAMLAVITVDEALELRRAGIETPILLLHEPPASRAHEIVNADLTSAVFTSAAVEALSRAASANGKAARVHLKVDTGLNRLGVPWRELPKFISSALADAKHLEIQGVFTHFAFADEPKNPVIDLQLSRFADAIDLLKQSGIEPEIRHAANSAALLGRSDAAFDMVRPGIALYGLSPGPQVPETQDLQPVMSLKARIAMVRDIPAKDGVSYSHRWVAKQPAKVATVPLGYADGWARLLTNNAQVLVSGQRCEAIGTVTMDSFVVDVTGVDANVGDEIVLIGAQQNERVTADELAERISTINYEIVTRMAARLPRIHLRT